MGSQTEYDFIVVGGGPAGAALTYGLGKAPRHPKVLLLEAGGLNDDKDLRVDGQRWQTLLKEGMNWGYKTAPQEEANGREIDYSRGRGVGGSSAINFGVWSKGARDDYDEWASVVGDKAFAWDRIKERFKSLETFHPDLPANILGRTKYAAPKAVDHGSSGPLHVGYAAEWEEDVVPLIELYEQAGFPVNPDHNSGNPLGISALISSAHGGLRTTARDLLEQLSPDNVTILTESPVQRVILDDNKKAVGVESNGRTFTATKEVILSAGALDTPRILMHSGIGPAAQLEKFNIPVVLDVPAVGQGLRDHEFCPLVYSRTDESTAGRAAFYNDPSKMDAALEQWKKDGTGPWAKFACQSAIGFFKLDDTLVKSDEFLSLPAEEQDFLRRETVPHYEIFSHFPIHWFTPGGFPPGVNYSCLLVFLYNSQAKGEVTLQSEDPNVPLRFDPKYLSTPFDRRVAIDSLRDALKLVNYPNFAKDTTGTLTGPASESDEDLLAYWRSTISSSWHMTGTTKMGTGSDAVVGSDFCVKGVGNLRIADMGVVPVLPSCHTQAVAYITGATCAEKLAVEYKLA